MPTYKLLAFSGSLRSASYNSSLVQAFIELAPENVSIEVADIKDIPLYDQDMEAEFPEAVSALKEKIRAADGILIATPEFNRSIPGVLKNTVDWTSRPYGDNAWDAKPVFVMGASFSPVGTALAQNDLKGVMLYLNARVLGQPEFYLGGATHKFNEEGKLTDEKAQESVKGAIAAFTAFIEQLR
ncbi:MAG: NADPH-dependent reductase [Parcubacteria group bacterium]|nr:NADPH-dependent reductase [Parcubacteria group bacterium]